MGRGNRNIKKTPAQKVSWADVWADIPLPEQPNDACPAYDPATKTGLKITEYKRTYYENGVIHRGRGEAVVTHTGTKIWYSSGEKHRLVKPAVVHLNGTNEWYHYGQRHRTDGPAIEYADGHGRWFWRGQQHREDGGQTVDLADGTKEWHQHDKLHRIDGPATITAAGSQIWYQHDLMHRDEQELVDGIWQSAPASIGSNNHLEWWVNGQRHREDGPAVVYPEKTCEWWWHGRRISEAEFVAMSALQTPLNVPATSLSQQFARRR